MLDPQFAGLVQTLVQQSQGGASPQSGLTKEDLERLAAANPLIRVAEAIGRRASTPSTPAPRPAPTPPMSPLSPAAMAAFQRLFGAARMSPEVPGAREALMRGRFSGTLSPDEDAFLLRPRASHYGEDIDLGR